MHDIQGTVGRLVYYTKSSPPPIKGLGYETMGTTLGVVNNLEALSCIPQGIIVVWATR